MRSRYNLQSDLKKKTLVCAVNRQNVGKTLRRKPQKLAHRRRYSRSTHENIYPLNDSNIIVSIIKLCIKFKIQLNSKVGTLLKDDTNDIFSRKVCVLGTFINTRRHLNKEHFCVKIQYVMSPTLATLHTYMRNNNT